MQNNSSTQTANIIKSSVHKAENLIPEQSFYCFLPEKPNIQESYRTKMSRREGNQLELPMFVHICISQIGIMRHSEAQLTESVGRELLADTPTERDV